MIAREMLRDLEPFKNMNESQLKRLQAHCQEMEFGKGDRLFSEGDDAQHLWVVRDGRIDLRFEMPDERNASFEQTVDSVEVRAKTPAAKVLGWSCFVPPYKMRLSAYSTEDGCRIIRVPKPDLIQLFKKDSHMGYLFMSYMIKVVGFRFHQFQDQVAKSMGDELMSGW